MSARIIIIGAVAAVTLSMGGCASQGNGSYAADHSSSLGGPRSVRVADAALITPQTFETETKYVYRGGRDPVTGMAIIQEGRSR